MDTYPTTFAVYQMHVSDPPYNTAWADTRKVFYGNIVDGLPWFAYDGLWDAWPIGSYESNLNLRQAAPTDVTIELYGTESGVQTYDIVAQVCIEPGGIDKTMRVYMIEALDHWPASPSYERNTCRQGATTEDVFVTAGSCATVTRTFTFDAISWAQQSDIKIIAWAQTPAVLYPGEVHQAKVMAWPFTPLTAIFADDFEGGTTDAWTSVTP